MKILAWVLVFISGGGLVWFLALGEVSNHMSPFKFHPRKVSERNNLRPFLKLVLTMRDWMSLGHSLGKRNERFVFKYLLCHYLAMQ